MPHIKETSRPKARFVQQITKSTSKVKIKESQNVLSYMLDEIF